MIQDSDKNLGQDCLQLPKKALTHCEFLATRLAHGYFPDKIKIFKANLRVNYCLLLKLLEEAINVPCFAQSGPIH